MVWAEAHKKAGEVICNAWQTKDYVLLLTVLADGIEWYEDSFEAPYTSPQAIVERWRPDLDIQTDISASITQVEVLDDISYQRCDARYTAKGVSKQLVGIFRMQLNLEGRIVRFEQWWSVMILP